MFPTINKKETGVNLRRIMDMRGVKPKDIQEYLGFGCVQSVYRWLDGVSVQQSIICMQLAKCFKFLWIQLFAEMLEEQKVKWMHVLRIRREEFIPTIRK